MGVDFAQAILDQHCLDGQSSFTFRALWNSRSLFPRSERKIVAVPVKVEYAVAGNRCAGYAQDCGHESGR